MHTDAARNLLEAALRYPGAHEDHPWGETVVKVDGKIFLFIMLTADGALRLTVKLPDQAADVLAAHAFTAPTGYGLGRSGWITAQIPEALAFDEGTLRGWLDASYRAVAKKGRIRELDASPER